jgi:putative SOS response-associated peptidase YedK
MCGRFTLQIPAELLAEIFGLAEPADLPARFNIAPTQQVAVVRQLEEGGNRLDLVKWGLIPSWAKDPSIGSRMINARSETLEEKPAFRAAFKHRRCLVPASGFYEWETLGGKKIPRYLRLKGGEPMVFAGLWESWRAPDGERVDSCTILTTAANSLIEPLHTRMPVILRPRDFELWLNRNLTDPAAFKELFQSYPSDRMEGWTVSTLVNSPQHDAPELVEPVPAGDLVLAGVLSQAGGPGQADGPGQASGQQLLW